MKLKKHNSKNLKIKTRVAVAAISGIATAIVMTAILALLLNAFLPSFYNFASVNTKSYSLLNQVQWSQTVSAITSELTGNNSRAQKEEQLNKIFDEAEKVNADIFIQKSNGEYFSRKSKREILEKAHNIVEFDQTQNVNYFGDNGLLIISHASKGNNEYTIFITSDDYSVMDTQTSTVDSAKLISTRTTFILVIIILILILSITVMSLITAQGITKPMKKLTDGIEEISKGNLDYRIDYDSTNEIGVTVKALNEMAARLKESIRQRNEIDESRKQMTAGIAHDLRTPLTSIKGYVEGLRDGIANTPEKQKEYIQTIYNSANDIERLLNELQTISLLERRSLELNKQEINLHEFLTDYVADAQFTAKKNNFEIIYKEPKDDDKNITVSLDPARFSRVLMNIVSNSIKYASKARNGKLTITLNGYDKSVIIALEDNGIGISDKNISHIFETFYRADQARTRVSDGSGIGLAVCKEIIEQHGGHIWATSTEGEGTTILISLNKITQEVESND
ncbi:HAMP domain-containing sensor histidine kinase [uncultured Eubacterium sp.]|uniref:HAMP domain-containing sensor histidine kinase n=1 Tax=uncultured Eubacterium sp. TaxID=165185 RepID=UPI0015AC30A8|nr:HAMP domain-containing sensor histidine kinase [uncultured Eubacterium sp.]